MPGLSNISSLSSVSSLQDGFGGGEATTFTIEGWFAEDASRANTAAYYKPDDETYWFQDTAGTTPVTAAGQDIRLIKNAAGNADFDLIIDDTLSPAVCAAVDGKLTVDLQGQAGFRSRSTVTLQVPLFVAAAASWQSTFDPIFGVIRQSTAQLQVFSPTNGQNRPLAVTHGGLFGGAYNPLDGAFRHFPKTAPSVIHSQFSAGSHDVAVNGLTPSSESNTWDAGWSDSAAYIAVGMATNTIEGDTQGKFYGGFVYLNGTPDSELRANIVADLNRQMVKAIDPADRNILIVGDSTGDEINETVGVYVTNGEWPMRFAQQLAADFPTHYVEIRGYETLQEYRPPVVVQSGTGGVIRIWNGSISGSQPGEALGANFQKMIADIPTCDTFIINHGYNIEASADPITAYADHFIPLIEMVKEQHPGAHMFLVRQPRTNVDTGMDNLVVAVDDVATLYGADTLDVWQQYQDYAGTFADLFGPDNLHPSEAGVDEWETRIDADYNAALPITTHGAGFIAGTPKTNLLSGGDFTSFTGGVPDGWTKVGSGTSSEEAVLIEAGETGVAKLVDTGATSSYYEQTVDATALRGLTITLTTRRYLEAADGDTPQSRLYLASDGTGTPVNYVSPLHKWRGGWQYGVVRLAVPADATTITIRLYARQAGTGAMTARYAWASLVSGNEPSGI